APDMATVTEVTPSAFTLTSLTGSGWNCSGNVCSRSDGLAAASSYPTLTATLSVASDAPAGVVNPVTVSAAGAPTVVAYNLTSIAANPPVLSITKTHSGSFTQGQNGAMYSVTVSIAAGAGPTIGTVTVTETVPPGMTLVSMAGAGWTCPG